MADTLPVLEAACTQALGVTVRALLYHDVVGSDADASGFSGPAAARYKLSTLEFDRHIHALHAAAVPAAGTALDLLAGYGDSRILFTVDDGGVSALHIADRLDDLGWRGHFFVTTERISTPGFLERDHIRRLHDRGHIIGAHSHSHPYRISELPDTQLDEEWSRSTAILSDIVGAAIVTASVPGGFFAPRVARAAAAAGIRVLFTSEPTTRVTTMHDCLIVGRFTIYRGVAPRTAAALAAGARLPVIRQQAVWAGKKALKRFAAPVWESMRRLVFRA